jgi:hypothetical protein
MDALRTTYGHHAFLFWLALLILLILAGLWILLLQLRMRRLEGRLQAIFADTSSDNMARMLVDYLATVRSTAAAVSRMKEEHDRIAAVMPKAIRHVGLVRFSPFHDTGGDQSFALALLDSHANGVVVTALHSRTDSRLYAKPIERGSSPYSLTPEEREAMDRALNRSVVETRT